jgi:chlorobactene glucosyltransferase
MYIIGFFISFALLIIGITVILNLVFFPRLQQGWPEEQPRLSVLIPARDEAAVISQTVRRVLAQTYSNFELIVLDDHSSDSTAELALQAAGSDERFHLFYSEALPRGWLGKNWACHQLSKAASGELLLFIDADVWLQSVALVALVGHMQRTRAELLTIWPTQLTDSWGERLVVPLINFAILGYLPILPVHYTYWHIFAAANGQCMMFNASAYQKVGGHAAVRDQVVEDVALARRVKARIHASPGITADWRNTFSSPLQMADGNRLISCRMYPQGWPQVRDGFSKNILSGHGNSVTFLLASTVFHWLVFIVPWVWLVFGGSWWALGLGIAGILIRGLTAAFAHQRVFDALWMPLSVVLMTNIALHAIIWHYSGTATWKGRNL